MEPCLECQRRSQPSPCGNPKHTMAEWVERIPSEQTVTTEHQGLVEQSYCRTCRELAKRDQQWLRYCLGEYAHGSPPAIVDPGMYRVLLEDNVRRKVFAAVAAVLENAYSEARGGNPETRFEYNKAQAYWKGRSDAAQAIRTIPRDRTALDELLQEAVEFGACYDVGHTRSAEYLQQLWEDWQRRKK